VASLIDSIVKRVLARVEERKRTTPIEALRARAGEAKRASTSFRAALEAKPFSLIAEIKRKSPSSGEMDPTNVADALAVYDSKTSISAISILTEEDYFAGSLDHLRLAREQTDKPLLRKDFILDEYQVWEARASGADAILIMAGLHGEHAGRATRLLDLAQSLDMDVLYELGMNGESDRPIAGATICGVNSRRFETTSLQVRSRLGRLLGAELSIDSDKHRALRPLVPDGRLVVAESGIDDPSRLRALFEMQYNAALIGTAFLKKGIKVADVVRAFDDEARSLWGSGAAAQPGGDKRSPPHAGLRPH
jgi:indole-3-glycerol phosphate synthase